MRKINKILKMFLYLIIGLITIAPIASSIYNRIGNCKISGEIKGLGTRLAVVRGGSHLNNDSYKKYILVINDKFSYYAKHNTLGIGKILTRNMLFNRANGSSLSMPSKIVTYYIKGDEEIFIKGSIDKYSVNYQISGDSLSKHHSKFKQDNLSLLVQETQIQLKLDSLNYREIRCDLIDSLYNQYDKLRERYNNKRLEYIQLNPTHELSAYLLRCQPKDTIIKYFPSLSMEIRLSISGREINEMIANK